MSDCELLYAVTKYEIRNTKYEIILPDRDISDYYEGSNIPRGERQLSQLQNGASVIIHSSQTFIIKHLKRLYLAAGYESSAEV